MRHFIEVINGRSDTRGSKKLRIIWCQGEQQQTGWVKNDSTRKEENRVTESEWGGWEYWKKGFYNVPSLKSKICFHRSRKVASEFDYASSEARCTPRTWEHIMNLDHKAAIPAAHRQTDSDWYISRQLRARDTGTTTARPTMHKLEIKGLINEKWSNLLLCWRACIYEYYHSLTCRSIFLYFRETHRHLQPASLSSFVEEVNPRWENCSAHWPKFFNTFW